MRRGLAAGLCVGLFVATAGMAGAADAPEAAFVTVETVPVSTQEMLFSATFPDATHGYAVGAFGRILATTDGGATWHEQDSGIPRDMTAAQVPGIECEDSCGNGLTSVSFVDAQRGWAAGLHNLLVRTTDGGATWTRLTPPVIEAIPGEGPGDVGETARPREWAFTDVAFTDGQNGTVVGEGGTILSTSDGGATWAWRGDRKYGGLSSMSFVDRDNGQVVSRGGNRRQPFVTVATIDAGTTWQMMATADPGPGQQNLDFRSVAFVDRQHGYVGSSAGQIFMTRDGGQHWAVQRKDTTETFQAIAFSGADRGLAVGYTDFSSERKASLVATADGGETWVTRLIPGVTALDVAFSTPTTAFVVGCAVHTREFLVSCQQSLMARVTFPAQTAGGSTSDGSVVPLVLVGAAVVVIGAGVVVLLRGRRTARH